MTIQRTLSQLRHRLTPPPPPGIVHSPGMEWSHLTTSFGMSFQVAAVDDDTITFSKLTDCCGSAFYATGAHLYCDRCGRRQLQADRPKGRHLILNTRLGVDYLIPWISYYLSTGLLESQLIALQLDSIARRSLNADRRQIDSLIQELRGLEV